MELERIPESIKGREVILSPLYASPMPWSPITEARETPLLAKQIRLQCPHCVGLVYVDLPYGWTTAKRQQLVHDAIDEHRKVCTGADATAGRVYTVEYPRA